MSVMYDPGKPPVLWASRASIHLAPDPWKAASEVRDMELGSRMGMDPACRGMDRRGLG